MDGKLHRLPLALLLSLVVVGSQANNLAEIPSKWFWGDVKGRSYLTRIQTERAPEYCRSSWAAATASALSDRLRKLRPEIRPSITISTQVLINCADSEGCSGGHPLKALEYIKAKGIPDETCQNYEGKQGKCDDLGICRDCVSGNTTAGEDFLDGHCFARHDYPAYGLDDYGTLKRNNASDNDAMVQKMKREVHTNGTITCGIRPSLEFEHYKEGILGDGPATSNHTHYVNVVGWDATEEPKYWIVRNCWGESWGIGGYAKIAMGINALGIEEVCYWGAPNVYPPTDISGSVEDRGLYRIQKLPSRPICSGFLPSLEDNREAHYGRSRPDITSMEIPPSYDIRNIDGRSYATIDKNQHIPLYCGSCTYFGSTSALADRLALLYKDTPPLFDISTQALINCAGHGCRGSLPDDLYGYMKDHYMPHESCSPYLATRKNCTAINRCTTCDEDDSCSVVPQGAYWDFGVKEMGRVVGETDIKLEILTSGPLPCLISVTNEFHQYTDGIFNDTTGRRELDHTVEVAGWGEQDGIGYWLIRNRFLTLNNREAGCCE